MERTDSSSQDFVQAVEMVLSEWVQCKVELDIHFKNRDSDRALPLMKSAIDLFEQFLFLSNSLNQDLYSINDCKIKPVNVEERLDFIVSRPKLFHSYKQLAELFAEQEKQFAKQAALNRAKNKRPD
ncbi:YpoC family protein [Mesobacillus sp.]|uniref:YpoC family protein n=1 Tax=Mesobacillus sp. TaxID=2675271 RepID=UPI0039EE7F20